MNGGCWSLPGSWASRNGWQTSQKNSSLSVRGRSARSTIDSVCGSTGPANDGWGGPSRKVSVAPCWMCRVPGANRTSMLRDLLMSAENLLTAVTVLGLLAWTDPAAAIAMTRMVIATTTNGLHDLRM